MNVFLVIRESTAEDGTNVFVTPCIDMETAQSVMEKEKNYILNNGLFEGVNPDKYNREEYAITSLPDRFLIETLYEDCSEEIYIQEKHLEAL